MKVSPDSSLLQEGEKKKKESVLISLPHFSDGLKSAESGNENDF